MVKPAMVPEMGGVEWALFCNRPVTSHSSFSSAHNHL